MKKNQLFKGLLVAMALTVGATAANADQISLSLKDARVKAPVNTQQVDKSKQFANPYEQLQQLDSPQGMAQTPRYEDAQTNGYQWLWQTNNDRNDGFSIYEESQMIKTADGGYVGVYTNGDGMNISAGYVKKMAADGTTLWEQKIQLGASTTSERLTQASNGNIMVIGSAVVEGNTRAYVATYNNAGEQLAVELMPDAYKTCYTSAILTYGDQEVAVFAFIKSDGTQANTYFTVDGNGKVTGSHETDKALTSYYGNYYVQNPNDVVISGHYMLLAFNSKYMVWNLNTGEATVTDAENSYVFGAANTSTGIALAYKNTNGNIAVTHLVPGESGLTTEWTKASSIAASYYFAFVTVDKDDNIYVTRRVWDSNAFVMLDKAGNIKHECAQLPFDSDEAAKYSFVYTAGQDQDGNYVFIGHAAYGIDFKPYIAKVNSEDQLVSLRKYIIDDAYMYGYTRKSMSFFDGDKLIIYGYLRAGDTNLGYSQYFAQFDLADSTSQVWDNISDPGRIPTIIPIAGVADKDNNSYVIANSNNVAVLFKYDADGNELWNATVPSVFNQCLPQGIVMLDNGNIVIGGYEYNSNSTQYTQSYQSFASCFSPSGDNLWHKTMGNTEAYYYMQGKKLLKTADGNVLMFSTAYDALDSVSSLEYRGITVMQKLNADGNIMWEKDINLDTISFNIEGAHLDKADNIVITANYFNADRQRNPIIGKFDKDGNQIFITSVLVDVPLQTPAGWTDDEGNTYAAGAAQINWYYYGFYIILDSEGSLVNYALDPRNGSYYDVTGKDDMALLCGTFSDTTDVVNYTVKGEIMAINSDGRQLWQNIYSNGDASTYLFYATIDQEISALGYVYGNDGWVDETLLELDMDGNITNQVATPVGYTSSSNYGEQGYYLGQNRFYALSYNRPASPLYVGIVNCYERNSVGSGVTEKQVVDSRDNISVVRNGDLLTAQGSNVNGITVYNMMGARVAAAMGNTVNVADLSHGVYVVTVTTTTGNHAVKVRL